MKEAFRGLACVQRVEPDANTEAYLEAYDRWHRLLTRALAV
jgi:hypothetical protein